MAKKGLITALTAAIIASGGCGEENKTVEITPRQRAIDYMQKARNNDIEFLSNTAYRYIKGNDTYIHNLTIDAISYGKKDSTGYRPDSLFTIYSSNDWGFMTATIVVPNDPSKTPYEIHD